MKPGSYAPSQVGPAQMIQFAYKNKKPVPQVMQSMQVKSLNYSHIQSHTYNNQGGEIEGSRNAGVSGKKSAEQKYGGQKLFMQGVINYEAP